MAEPIKHEAGEKPTTNVPREDAKVVAPREENVTQEQPAESPEAALAREQREKAVQPAGLSGIEGGASMRAVPPQQP